MNKTPTPALVTYCRVSTAKQGASGLGLDAQQSAIDEHVRRHGGVVVGMFVEVETGKGSNALEKRPQLAAALALAKAKKATLVIAKLDRLARNVHFISGLMEAGVSFVALDMPEANKLTVHVMAAFAEHERDMISKRTKEALAEAKHRGVALGVKGAENAAKANAERRAAGVAMAEGLRADLERLKSSGATLRGMAAGLAEVGHVTASGQTLSPTQVQRLLNRLEG